MTFNNFIIEKCSESIGIILVLFFLAFFLIKFHPHITDSLFAINSFLLIFIISSVGSRPAIPGIADIVILFFLLKFISLILFKIFTFLILEFFLTFANTFLLFIIK